MRYFGSYGGLQSFFFLALRFDGLTNTMSLVRVFVSDVSLGEVCDRSKDKPVANPWLCGDRLMVYVNVSNLECPCCKIVMVGGTRIVMFASVCGLMLLVSFIGLLGWHLRLLSFHSLIGSESDVDLTVVPCRSFIFAEFSYHGLARLPVALY